MKIVLQVAIVLVFAAFLVCMSGQAVFRPAAGGEDDPVQRMQELHDNIRALQESGAATTEVLDPWGTGIRIEDTRSVRWIISAGPDRLFDSQDDLRYTSSKTP